MGGDWIMNWVDFWVVVIVVILVGLVIFFHYIFPHLRKGPSTKAKRLVKDYFKAKKKEEK